MKGFIQKYILPREVDFNAALREQVCAVRQTVLDLCEACLDDDRAALKRIVEDERRCHALKNRNMREPLDVFITPYDREAIYRIIDQLDWVALSVKHLGIDLLVYEVICSEEEKPVLTVLREMADSLREGFVFLGQRQTAEIVRVVNEIYVRYDQVVQQCALAAAHHLKEDAVRDYLARREIIAQLKEVARRIRVSANSLEDLAVKTV